MPSIDHTEEHLLLPRRVPDLEFHGRLVHQQHLAHEGRPGLGLGRGWRRSMSCAYAHAPTKPAQSTITAASPQKYAPDGRLGVRLEIVRHEA